ncbi:PRAG1 kinase, partial [Rhinopomastus cyanomelas]|nr:PRAG1 kinase [Rhinopomastus cyanomelas]
DPLPPPLPKKQLQRAESLPEQGPPHRPRAGSIVSSSLSPHLQREKGASSALPPRDRPSWDLKKPLTKSHSLGEPAPRGSPPEAPSPSPAELTFGVADGELGQLLESPSGVCGVVLGCQAAALARLSAHIQEELMGPEERHQLLEAELAGQSWAALSVLERQPCCESREAWYYRVGFAFRHSRLVLAAKVPKPSCTSPGPRSPPGVHCSLQRLIGRFTSRLPQELVLPGSPSGEDPEQPTARPVLQVSLCAEVPYQTLAAFVQGSRRWHRGSPGHYERLACLLLLQLCMGLEHLRGQHTGHGDLCPENLLLVQCPPRQGQQGQEASPGLPLPRLLISSFSQAEDRRRPHSRSHEQDWPAEAAAAPALVADELGVAVLIYQLLHVDVSLEQLAGLRSSGRPELPALSIYSWGLGRLAALLLHRDPCQRVSVEQARSVLQVLLWGPRQELFARSRKSLALLRSWLQAKRALLLLRFAESAAGGPGSPGLEEWLCCQYFGEATEHALCHVTQLLY